MKTTLNIDDTVMARLKEEAARQRMTMSAFVESALRLQLEASKAVVDLPPLPRFNSGPFLIDVADRNAIYDLFDADNDLYK